MAHDYVDDLRFIADIGEGAMAGVLRGAATEIERLTAILAERTLQHKAQLDNAVALKREVNAKEAESLELHHAGCAESEMAAALQIKVERLCGLLGKLAAEFAATCLHAGGVPNASMTYQEAMEAAEKAGG